MLKRVTTDRTIGHDVFGGSAEGDAMAGSGYGRRLKDLRERAKLTQAECAKTLGISQGGYSNYENEKRYQDNPIPGQVVVSLMPLFVSRGDPPVQMHELLEISDIRSIQGMLGGMGQKAVQAAPREMDEFAARANTIAVRYTIEKGVYRSDESMGQATAGRARGSAPVLPLKHYPHDKQWGAALVDDSGQRIGLPRYTLLHCVDVAILSPADLPPGSIVVAARRKDTLTEVILAVVDNYTMRGAKLTDAETGKAVDAEVLGAALYRYGPVAEAR